MIAFAELFHCILNGLILLVLKLQRDNRQAVEEENEINLLVRFAEVKMRPKRDAVLFDIFRWPRWPAERGLG